MKRKPPPGNVRRVICLGHNIRGVTTNKRGHLIQFESEQEHKLVLLLERDPTVADYTSQPETLHFLDDNGRQRAYTPDFKVWRTDGQIELHEVTVETRRAARASLQLREAAAQALCLQQGWRYIVHTDQTLPSGYEYVNLEFLAAFRATIYADAMLTAWWLRQLTQEQQVHPRSILLRAGPDLTTGPLLNSLYHLLWHSAIQMDWRQPFIWRSDFHPAARIWLSTADLAGPRPEFEVEDSRQVQEVLP